MDERQKFLPGPGQKFFKPKKWEGDPTSHRRGVVKKTNRVSLGRQEFWSRKFFRKGRRYGDPQIDVTGSRAHFREKFETKIKKFCTKSNFFALFRLHELSSAIITSHQGTRALDALEAMSGRAAKRTRGQPGKVSGLQEQKFLFSQNLIKIARLITIFLIEEEIYIECTQICYL